MKRKNKVYPPISPKLVRSKHVTVLIIGNEKSGLLTRSLARDMRDALDRRTVAYRSLHPSEDGGSRKSGFERIEATALGFELKDRIPDVLVVAEASAEAWSAFQDGMQEAVAHTRKPIVYRRTKAARKKAAKKSAKKKQPTRKAQKNKVSR